MTELTPSTPSRDFLSRSLLASANIDWEKVIYISFLILAIVSRFWGLGDRVMSHDESLHTQFSYQFYVGDGYSHTPLMHGPFLFHITAVSYWLFGANDVTARIPVAILGVVLVMLPYFLRPWLGRAGALFASFFFLISPYITYYSRYIRHDIYVIVWAMIVFIAIWHYFRERQEKYLWWFAAGTALMFATKEVSFIYVAIFGSFLILRLLPQMLMAPWFRSKAAKLTQPAMVVLVSLLLIGGSFIGQELAGEEAETTTPEAIETFAADPEEDAALTTDTEDVSSLEKTLGWVQASGFVLLGVGLFLGARQLRPYLDNYPEFDLIILFTTLILPMVSPFLVVMVGGNPRDYSINRCVLETAEPATTVQLFFARLQTAECWTAFFQSPIILTTFFLLLTLGAAILVGLWWNRRRWLIAAAIFHGIFLVLYTSVFTNPGGWTSGMIGSLAYWLEQQGVARGSQPPFYYFFVVPFYEFLPLVFSLLAARLWLFQMRLNKAVGYWITVILLSLLGYSLGNWLFNLNNVAIGAETTRLPGIIVGLFILGASILGWFLLRRGQLRRESGIKGHLLSQVPHDALCGFVPFTIWWLMVTWVAYSAAGEKMPWLSTHFVIPMALLAGWYFNEKLQQHDWDELLSRRSLLYLGLTVVLIVAVVLALGPVLLGKIQLGDQQASNLNSIGRLLGSILAAGVLFWFWQQVGDKLNGRLRTTLFSFGVLVILSLLTIRFTYMASFPNADYVREFMVYAHGAPAAKEIVLDQVEELSLRLHGDNNIKVAFGGRGVAWPFTWYMRQYPNSTYYGVEASQGANLTDSPIVLAGRSESNGTWDNIDAILGNNYEYRTYTYLWWPAEEYRKISWNALFGDPNRPEGVERRGLLNPNVRQAIWDIFFYRDYEKYGQTFGGVFTDNQWPLRDDLRLYIRRDVLAQLWDYGIDATNATGLEVPYETGAVAASPSLVIEGNGLFAPRNVAVGEDGRIYVLDSGNQRVQIYDQTGQLVDSWGSPGAEPGQFSPEGQGPWGIAVDDEFVYVADTWNHRIQKFTLDGEVVGVFGRAGNVSEAPETGGLGIFFGPRDIALVGENQLLVTDTGHHRIQIIDRDGSFLGQVGAGGDQFGSAPGQFYEPVGIGVGPNGLVYVADTWNGRIQQFNQNLQPINEWRLENDWASNFSINNKPYLAVDSAGRIYATDPEEFRVLIFAPDGTYLGRFGQFGTDANSLGLPTGITIDAEDNIYVADAENNRILKYEPIFAPLPTEPVEDEEVPAGEEDSGEEPTVDEEAGEEEVAPETGSDSEQTEEEDVDDSSDDVDGEDEADTEGEDEEETSNPTPTAAEE